MTDKVIQRTVETVSQISMNMRVVLKQKQVKLYLGFRIGRLMHNPIHRLYLAFNQFPCGLITSLDEVENSVESLNRVQKQTRRYRTLLTVLSHQFLEEVVEQFE